jgi:hypothetical protein
MPSAPLSREQIDRIELLKARIEGLAFAIQQLDEDALSAMLQHARVPTGRSRIQEEIDRCQKEIASIMWDGE